ncbi:MAG: CusA/CzcA family heavy metal efflux RND transporter [Candidatus Sericytochromatia bacterium]
MEDFFAKFIKNRLLIILVFVICFVGGIYSYNSLPIDAFPDLTNNQVQVLTEAPGMSPLEVEQRVSIPIENVMNGIPDTSEIRSTSKFGLSIVSIVFKDSVNTYFARQLVNERLLSIKDNLPKNVRSEMSPPATAMGEVYQYVVEAKDKTPMELKTINDWEIKNQLRTVQGITEINTSGGYTMEYKINLIPEKLIQYKLTLPEVFSAIEENNDNFSGGIIERNSQQYIISGLGRVKSIKDIESIVIKTIDNTPLLIKDIAQVGFYSKIRQGAVTKDGKGEVVTGLTMMLKGENSRNVIARVKDKIEEVKKTLPEGVTITPFYDQTNLVEQTVTTVKTNLVEGGTLVIVILLLMLGNIKAALIVSATIPLSLMFSFMGMKAMGISANIMSLGAIDFGMIVDGSVVIVENTIKNLSHSDHKKSNFAIIQDSLKEMAKPIMFGTLIITVVYLPILSLEGVEYKMFSPMVITVTFALIGSLLISLTLVPVMCTYFLRHNVQEKENFLIHIANNFYEKALSFSLKNNILTILLGLVLFISSLFIVPLLGTEFVPKLDEGDILIEAKNIPGIAVSEAVKNSTKLEKALIDLQEIKTIVCKTGRTDIATDAMGVYQTDVYVILKNKKEWRKGITKDKLIDEMRERLEQKVSGVNFNFTQPIAMRVDELVSGVKADVAIKIFGEDINILGDIAEKVRAVTDKIKGNSDLQIEAFEGGTQVKIIPDREKLALYGLKISDLALITETSIMGKDISEIIEGKKRFTLRVGFPNAEKTSIEDIKNLLLRNSKGELVKLEQVAEVKEEEDLEAINREFGERRLIVQTNVRGRDVGSFVKELREQIDKNVKIPSGYYIKYGGQFQNQERAMKKLSVVVPASIVVIMLLLMGNFSSIKHSLIVMLNVPFALSGGILALYLRGMYFSVSAAVGFIALFGVAVLNGIVLITTINNLRGKHSEKIEEAIFHGAKDRLRPVLMTAMVAMFGFLPMAISNGSGAEVQKPLATVVIGGLFTSTFLTLFVLPSVYLVTHKRKK